jgi:NAD(P)-dependent dehydrogenase (short-subunit alcohol dehydrogenase family)
MAGKYIKDYVRMNALINNFNLNGKTAVITGSAGLLGAEHAAALIECGAEVVLTDVSQAMLDKTKSTLLAEFSGAKIITKVMDVSNQKEVQETSSWLLMRNIRVDILVNNAALDPKVSGERGLLEASRLENFTLDQWNAQIAVGLTGAFLCSKVFGGEMAKDGLGGVILNIASDLSVISPDQRLYRKPGVALEEQPVKPVSYSVIKSGIVGLTRYLATYWLEGRIRCNALSPGGIYNGQSEEFVRSISALIPMGRMANRNEYRSAVQFLCSDASTYLNGQNIVMDGGRSVW